MEKHPLHLKIPDLQKSEEVQKSVKKKERLEEIDIPNNPNERIDAYLNRLEKIFLNPDERVKERNLELIRPILYDKCIIKPEGIPESYFELQKQIARDRGQTIEEIPQEARDQIIETIVSDQKHSLDQWVDYLTSDDVAYPTWFKYFVFRNVLKLSQFDKDLGKFKERTNTTTAPYPDIYRAPLAKILDIYNEAIKFGKSKNEPEFSKSFPKLYAELISESLAHQIENKEEIKGQWIKYNQSNQRDADRLFDSVQAKGTGWCIEGHSTASSYVNQGDFYVYYTYDQKNNPTQPRIAIQMTSNKIGQIRGILPHQELEPIMTPVIEEKLKEFGTEADEYKKKTQDMRKMTEVYNKSFDKNKNYLTPKLSKEELIFLYEIDNKIEGFGYEEDSRIREVRDRRNPREDAPIVLDCKPEEIATNKNEISKNTKAYIGSLFKGIFKHNIEHIFTSFPEGKTTRMEATIGGKTREQLKKELKNDKINISDYANQMMDNKDFATLPNPEQIRLIRLSVKDLGFSKGATTDEIYKKAQELGLELCPAEVGPNLRLQYTTQPLNKWLWIGMKQITDADGDPSVFYLVRGSGGLWLYDRWAEPTDGWGSVSEFVFCLRK